MKFAGLPSWIRHGAVIEHLRGSVIWAQLARTFIGEYCEVRCGQDRKTVLCEAETIGFDGQSVLLSVLGDTQGIPTDAWVMGTGQRRTIEIGSGMPGSVLDGRGNLLDRLCESASPTLQWDPRSAAVRCLIDQDVPSPLHRSGVDQVFETGLRAIDGLLTCGQGQRIGIFATAGVGKTSLMSALIHNAKADMFIVGLVGERGREAAEFIASGVPDDKRGRTVVVCSTSDRPPAERRNAAHMATRIAEHYRDAGMSVVLMVDSITRYARALRDVALSAGELPARRGYPASVFEALPRLLERSGRTRSGSITAFYTVLIEDEDQAEPIGDEVRSILDGHIYLSRRLAERGHYPAIDVLKSNSRIMHRLVTDGHRERADAVRAILARLDDLRLVLELGEYVPGSDPSVDALVAVQPALNAWLRQQMGQCVPLEVTRAGLNDFG